MFPTPNIIQRVFNIRVIDIVENENEVLSAGTMFVIDIDNRQYLITARHIARHIVRDTQVQVWRNGRWNSIPVRIVGHGEGDVDVSVLDSNISLIPIENRFDLPTGGLNQMILGQEMMFFGFPVGYDVSTAYLLPTGYPMPLVKYARLSGWSSVNHPLWFDGHNNQGFSGAPICFVMSGDDDLVRVAGVVAAYQTIPLPVYNVDGDETELYYRENMGLGLAWNIQHCIDIINRNPIGLELPNQ